MSRAPRHVRLFRALLRLFPSEFRGEFGDEMLEDFRDQYDSAARRRGISPVARLWMRTVTDHVFRAPSEHLDIVRRDAGYAVRLLRRRPALAASALLTLAIGIGLNAAVFSFVRGVLWRSLPLPEGNRLVDIRQVSPPPESEPTPVSPANFIDWEAQSRSLDGLATISWRDLTLIGDADPEQIRAATVSRAFFRIVPVRPVVGRLFSDDDYRPLATALQARDPKRPSLPPDPGSAILSQGLWLRHFGGRPDVVGRRIRLGRLTVEVVGVLERGFAFPGSESAECWLPDVPDPIQRRARYLSVVGRLAPGATARGAQVEFDVIASRLAQAYPDANTGRGVRIVPLLDRLTAPVRAQFLFLLAAAACVLLIACANVANLLLAHASGRRLEFATRMALGANRGHLGRQAITEGLLLALGGGAAGVLLAWWALPALVALAPPTVPRLNEISVDSGVVTFAALMSLAVGLACGAIASLSARRLDVSGALRSAAPGSARRGRFRQGLVVAEIALALMLVIAAGLLVRTMRQIGGLDLGFNPAGVIAIGLSPDVQKYGDAGAKARFESELIERVRALPGVVAAGIGSRPLGGAGTSTIVTIPGNAEEIRVGVDAVGPGYLEALGARLDSGRFFDARDDPGAPLVAIANESLARQLWGTPHVLRQTLVMDARQLRVVGVLADVRRAGLEALPPPTLYLATAQTRMFWTNNMLVRTSGDPVAVLPAVRSAMRQIDPGQALTRIETLEERLSKATAPRRYLLWLVGLFSAMALGLAMIGVYGVVAESVAQRIPEIGMRIALGATVSDIMRLILTQSGGLVGCGIALGALGAVALHRTMSAFVFQVSTTDPATYAVAGTCLVAVTLATCVVPARRAARIDPVRALRSE